MNLLAAENTVQSDLLAELLFGLAQPVPGSRLDDEELRRVAGETFLDRPFCIVRRWMLIDVMLSANREKAVVASKVSPRVLFANEVIYAQPRSLPTPKGLISSFQTRYEDCFFETQDMLYILAGQGGQRYASAPAVAALSQWLGQDDLRNLV